MDPASNIFAFSTRAARARGKWFGGIEEQGTADRLGRNLQVVSTQAKFAAVFVKMANRRDIEEHGFLVDCHAVITVRGELGISFQFGDAIVYLPENETYHVCELGKQHSVNAEMRYALRRLET